MLKYFKCEAGKKWSLQPKIEWVEEIVQAASKAGVLVFLKDNLRPLYPDVDVTNFSDGRPSFISTLRQEVPK